MNTYTLEQLKGVFIPKNTTVPRNNKSDFAHGLNRPNDAISLFNYVLDCITYSPTASGITDLSISNRTSTTLNVDSSTGADATIPASTATLAGLESAVNNVKLSNITITQPVDLDALEQDVEDLTTLTGVASNSTHLGTFSGTTIPDNSTIKAALQALEAVIGAGNSENGISGTGTSGDKYRLGGTLNTNTIINGAYTRHLIINDTTSITLEADNNTTGHAKSSLFLTSILSAGAALRSEINGTSTQYAEVRVDPDGALTALQQVSGGQKCGIFMPGVNNVYMENNDGTVSKKLQITAAGHFATNINSGISTKVVYIDDVTGELLKGDAASGTGSPISKYDAGNGAYVTATGSGITFAKAAGVGTFTIPPGVDILTARISGATADLSGNAFSFTYTTDIADDFPSVTKINTISGAGASPSVPYVYDIDNTPQIQCTASGTTMTVRVINLNAFATWALKIVF